MARTDHCPICNVAVKPENLLRHVNETHPRHPDTPAIRERLKAEPGRITPKRTGAPIRVRGWHVAAIALIVLGGAGAYYIAPYLSPGSSQPFPCVVGTNFAYHWHPQLNVFSGGVPFTVPADIGITPGCLEPLHTHDTSGQIHIETTVNRLYTIGDFFLVWKKPFGAPTQMLVNGTSTAPNASVILYDQPETIALYYTSFS